MPEQPPFWKTTPLSELTEEQWESLCDGCAKCCLQKLEEEDNRKIYYTNVACAQLDPKTGKCSSYDDRANRAPNCVSLNMEELDDPYWLPSTCAYRLVSEGKDLPEWHPLVSGDPATVITSGNSVSGRVIREDEAGDLEHHLIDWAD